jgi:oligopeptide transport system substrate-binding protein
MTDLTSFHVVAALMDPLVRLEEDLNPQPALAKSWEVTGDDTVVTYTLRDDGRWTNGDKVTAGDFEYAWKRAIAPETAAGYAYQFFGIVGAQDYNGCKKDCEKLREQVGVRALDESTLEVKLTSPQPWFVSQAAHLSFLPVHRATVEDYGDKRSRRTSSRTAPSGWSGGVTTINSCSRSGHSGAAPTMSGLTACS